MQRCWRDGKVFRALKQARMLSPSSAGPNQTPARYSGEALFPPARIIALARSFSMLSVATKHPPASDRHEALEAACTKLLATG